MKSSLTWDARQWIDKEPKEKRRVRPKTSRQLGQPKN
jgi:hypothetical protein